MTISNQEFTILNKWLIDHKKEHLFIAALGAKESFKKRVLLVLLQEEFAAIYLNERIIKESIHQLQDCMIQKISFGVLSLRFDSTNKKSTSYAFIPDQEDFTKFKQMFSDQVSKQKTIDLERKLEANRELDSKRGSFLGSFEPETGIQKHERSSSKYGDRKFMDLLISNGKKINVYAKMIECAGSYYEIDKFVTADVISDGQIQVSRRPTLTRMGALAFLPGTALIPGMALAKKTTHDNREVVVSIAHPNWSLNVKIRPAELGPAKTLAMRINTIADSLKEVSSDFKIDKNDKNTTSTVEQLKEVKQLLESGFISENEASELKNKILGS